MSINIYIPTGISRKVYQALEQFLEAQKLDG